MDCAGCLELCFFGVLFNAVLLLVFGLCCLLVLIQLIVLVVLVLCVFIGG